MVVGPMIWLGGETIGRKDEVLASEEFVVM